MELDDEEYNVDLKADLNDLWQATLYIGKTVEEYDTEHSDMVPRFVRTEEWREALTSIRKSLKKYYKTETYPVIRKLAEWHVFRQKLLPMLRTYSDEPDTVYNIAKVLLFMTSLLPDPAAQGRKLSSVKNAAREAAIRTVQDTLFELVGAPDVLATLLSSLCAPALKPGRRDGNRAEGEVNRVDLFLSLIKQLLECPPAAITGGAAASALAFSRLGQRERFILVLQDCAVLDVLVELSRLMDRREFSRLSPTLLDIWYHVLKAESSEALAGASKDVAHSARAEEQAAEAHAAALATATAEAARLASCNAGGGFQSPYKSAKPVSVPLAVHKKPSEASARLAALVAAEKANRAPLRASFRLERHSRFGTRIVHTPGNEPAGVSRIFHSVLTSSATQAVDTAPRAAKRGGGGGRKKETDTYVAPAVIDVAAARGVSSGGTHVSGLDSRPGVPAALLSQLRLALCSAALAFLESKTITLRLGKQKRTQEERRKKEEEEDEELLRPASQASEEEGQEDEAMQEGEEVEEETVTISAFATLTKSLKDRIARDSDDLTPSDRLKYYHVCTVLMGLHRLVALPALKAGEDAARKAKKEGREVQGGTPRYDASPLLECLDAWSFRNVVAVCDDYTTRKVWQALGVAGAHLAQLVLTTHTMVEYGDEETSDIGAQVYDMVFRERDVSEALPRVFRQWEPRRFHADFVPTMVEAAHYTLKLAERAAEEGMQTRGGRKSGTLSAVKRGGGEEGEDEEMEVGERKRRAALEEAATAERRQREHAAKKEKTFQASRYTSEYVHPAIISATASLLARYAHNSVKSNYFAVSLLRRIDRLPNEYAGVHPKTGKPLTYSVALYNYKLLSLAEAVLHDASCKKGKATGEVYVWAKEFASGFAAAVRDNPALVVEALFWRAGKEANAEVAKHYGVLDGTAASELHMHGELSEEAWGDLLAKGYGEGGGKPKKKTKAAVAADEAEAQAEVMRREKAARRGRAEEAEGQGEEDAVVDFDAEEDVSRTKARTRKEGKRGGGKKEAKRRRAALSDSGSSSDSSSSSSSGSSSSGGALSDAGRAAAPQLRTLPKAPKRATIADSSDDDDEDMGRAPSSGTVLDKEEEEEEEEEGEEAHFDPDLALAQVTASFRPRVQAGPAAKRARRAGVSAESDDSDSDSLLSAAVRHADAVLAAITSPVELDLHESIRAVLAASLPAGGSLDEEEEEEDVMAGGGRRGGATDAAGDARAALRWLKVQLTRAAQLQRASGERAVPGIRGVSSAERTWLACGEMQALMRAVGLRKGALGTYSAGSIAAAVLDAAAQAIGAAVEL